MADFAPPPGPPPPKVPEGWKPIWNDQYKEWFYVNTHTKQSQWNRPMEPVYQSQWSGTPPPYDLSTKPNRNQNQYQGSNNHYAGNGTQSQQYGLSSPGPRSDGRGAGGLFGKLKAKIGGALPPRSGPGPQQQYPPQGYGGGYPHPQQPAPGNGAPPIPPKPGKKPGLGMGAGVAMGAGAGLLGGALLMQDQDGFGDAGGDDYDDGGF